ncbi:MAG: division/cell wall cluster transcriptional repressor MraZ [Thermodesulfobacteriota bacterium]
MTEDVLAQISSFRGNTEHGLDGKGRLNIPARFKDVLSRKYDERLVVIPWRDCLRVYPLLEWARFEEALLNRKQDRNTLKRVRLLIGRSAELQLDRNGRILVPAAMRKLAGLASNVVLTGMGPFFEIWDQEGFAAVIANVDEDDFDELEETIHELSLF